MVRIEFPVFSCDVPNCGREFMPTVRDGQRASWHQAREAGWQHGKVRPMLGGIVVEPDRYVGEICPLHAPGKTGIIISQDELDRMGAEKKDAAEPRKKAVRRRNVASLA